MSFSSLILSLCRVHGRERPVWSCGVVEWIGRPLISPTPNPGHRQVTTGRRTDFGVKKSSDFSDAGRRTDFRDQKSRAFFWRVFLWRAFFWSSITARELCSHQCLWSGFIFPELEHLYKNVFTASFPKRNVRNVGCSFVSKKRTRSGSNVSSRVGKDQLSIHFTSLLDDLKSSKDYCPRTVQDYCPRNLFSGSNSSPEKSSPEKSSRFLSRKSVQRPA